MSSPAEPLAKSRAPQIILPAVGWLVFYAAVAFAWIGLIQLGAAGDGFAGFLQRCQASPATLGFVHLATMWALMSLGMMLPTAFPALQRFAILVQNGSNGTARFLTFLAAYALIWLGFSLLAAGLQIGLAKMGWLGPDGHTAGLWLTAALLGFAGLYQFSKAKHACLTRCRHPMTFFMANWRDGMGGAFNMGLKHGRDCLGCCWALMSLSFIGGAMSLGWMGFAMVLMLLEKLAGPGRYVTLFLGLILVSAAGFVAGHGLQML